MNMIQGCNYRIYSKSRRVPQAVIVRGIPGSGKSTFAKNLATIGYDWFEADMYMVDENGEYRFDRSKLAEAHSRCLEGFKQSLRVGYSVVVANTFVKAEHILPYTSFCEEREIFYRVVVCQGFWPNVHGVPAEVVERMRREFEPY